MCRFTAMAVSISFFLFAVPCWAQLNPKENRVFLYKTPQTKSLVDNISKEKDVETTSSHFFADSQRRQREALPDPMPKPIGEKRGALPDPMPKPVDAKMLPGDPKPEPVREKKGALPDPMPKPVDTKVLPGDPKP